MTLRRSVLRAGGLALFVSVAVLSSASSASAGQGATVGGESNITAEGDPTQTPLCLLVSPQPNRTEITLYNTGTFGADTRTLYTHIARFDAETFYYFGPEGTYSDAQCTMEYAVPGTLTVSGGGGVTCDAASATYERRGTAYTITTTESTQCDLPGGGQNPFTVNDLTYTGTQLACTTTVGADNCADPPGPTHSQEFTGVYSQS